MDSLGLVAVSIAIINDGRISYHRASGVMDLESNKKVDNATLFEAASTSKPVFAFLAMKMVERGLLDLDKPLYQYLSFPELENDDRYKRVTARMVLAHSTGFPNWRWLDPATGNWSSENKIYMLHEPGTFSYSGEAYHYLAKVVAHVCGVTLHELDSVFRRQVAIPLGMKYAYFSWNDHMGENKVTGYEGDRVLRDKWESADAMYADSTVFGAANGLHTEAVSYANFLIALMENRGLKKATIGEMLKIHTRIPEDQLPYYGPIRGWGLGFAVEPSDQGTRFSHSGYNPGFVAFFMFDREHKNGYVFFTNSVDKAGVLEAHLRKFLNGGR
jgi:CubicO group peptidase (beta-lactamase class C family)